MIGKPLTKLEEDNAMKHFVREKFNDINIALEIIKKKLKL